MVPSALLAPSRNRSVPFNSTQERQEGTRRLSSGLVRGVKASFLCGQSHRVNDKHPREEVTAAINQLKAMLPSAVITVSDMAYVVYLCVTDGDPKEQADYIDAEWAEESCKEISDSTLASVAHEEPADIKQSLSDASFLHDRSIPSTRNTSLVKMYAQLLIGKENKFLCLRLLTCANRRSIMPRQQ